MVKIKLNAHIVPRKCAQSDFFEGGPVAGMDMLRKKHINILVKDIKSMKTMCYSRYNATRSLATRAAEYAGISARTAWSLPIAAVSIPYTGPSPHLWWTSNSN